MGDTKENFEKDAEFWLCRKSNTLPSVHMGRYLLNFYFGMKYYHVFDEDWYACSEKLEAMRLIMKEVQFTLGGNEVIYIAGSGYPLSEYIDIDIPFIKLK